MVILKNQRGLILRGGQLEVKSDYFFGFRKNQVTESERSTYITVADRRGGAVANTLFIMGWQNGERLPLA